MDDEFKGFIQVGSISGHWEQSLTRIVDRATAQLEYSLQWFNQFLQRLIVFMMAFSIIGTLAICML